jgi:uncharacterized protein YvpB
MDLGRGITLNKTSPKKIFAFILFVALPLLALTTHLFYLAYQNFSTPSTVRASIIPAWLTRGNEPVDEPVIIIIPDKPYTVQTANNSTSFETITEAFNRASSMRNTAYLYKNNLQIWSNTPVGTASILIETPNILQRPLLDRGCGVVSLTMLLNFYGIEADKMVLAEQITKTAYPGDPNVGFPGNIYTFRERGLGVYHTPIFELLQQYIPDYAVDLTGLPFDAVLYYLSNNRPVWVVTNYRHTPLPIPGLPTHDFRTVALEDGREIQITYAMHSVLVTGFDDENIYFNDPLDRFTYAPIERFVAAWEQMGRQAVAVAK